MKKIFCLTLLLIFMASINLCAISIESTKLAIEFDKEQCKITIYQGENRWSNDFSYDQIAVSEHAVYLNDKVLFNTEGIVYSEGVFSLTEFSIDEIEYIDGRYLISFEKKKEKRSRSRRGSRSRDRVLMFEDHNIPENDYVRGDVIVIGADLYVDGEVEGDILVLFGDIKVTRNAICRRNVIALGGSIDRNRQAKIYGSYQSTEKWHKKKPRRRKYQPEPNTVNFTTAMHYNRVDGVFLYPGISFKSEEDFLPEFYANWGYAFWPQRSRYRIGFKQSLFSYHRLNFGASVYQETKTEDNWRCGTNENNTYALLAREDLRDYYEGEGGDIFIEQTYGDNHSAQVDYSFETLRWMPANPNLWSLFGGSKKFRSNFSSLDDNFLAGNVDDYLRDDAAIAFRYKFDTIEDEQGELTRTGWSTVIRLEHSSDAFGSDFNYDRAQIELKRYQPLTYRQNLNVRMLYATSHGDLPMHKLYYLGGIRTLRAYKTKEFYGTRMALLNLEYVVEFPNTDIRLAALFDIGKTGYDSDFLSDGDFKADAGVGFSIGEGIRAELTRQINGSKKSIQFSILIGKTL